MPTDSSSSDPEHDPWASRTQQMAHVYRMASFWISKVTTAVAALLIPCAIGYLIDLGLGFPLFLFVGAILGMILMMLYLIAMANSLNQIELNQIELNQRDQSPPTNSQDSTANGQ